MTLYVAAAAAEEDRGWGGIVALAIAVVLYLVIRHAPGWVRGWREARAVVDEDLADDDEVLVDEPPAAPTSDEVPDPRLADYFARLIGALWDRDPQPLPSPTGRASAREDAQVTEVSPPDDTISDTSDVWGTIVTLEDGRRVRAHVLPASASVPADAPEGEDAPTAQHGTGDGIDGWVTARMRAGTRTADIVAGAMRRYGVSRSTVHRTIRRVRAAGRHLD